MNAELALAAATRQQVGHAADDPARLDDFVEFVRDAAFPCVGAKSALARGSLRIVACGDITSAWDDIAIHRELMNWAQAYTTAPGLFRSIAMVFSGPADLEEIGFEQAMWQRLQSLSDKDAWLGQPYDRRVSPQVDDPHFSLSFGGQAFFVVGLHPSASRPARRFRTPALVFNLHAQFEELRSQNRYERLRGSILERDIALAGSINPMLVRHGEASEAAQYSGRIVSDGWQCPFSDPRQPRQSQPDDPAKPLLDALDARQAGEPEPQGENRS